ncbi:hypothetical protein E2C01_064425 [Portunus trituberculatus]|uniref:Uncharacterized protein n=1 Tax=Portunus trituberculatus TaxID=210409 RepID=A0A5B7HNQ8_PORTR|nr:hypothetical protein [Portunus trituberculatus]
MSPHLLPSSHHLTTTSPTSPTSLGYLPAIFSASPYLHLPIILPPSHRLLATSQHLPYFDQTTLSSHYFPFHLPSPSLDHHLSATSPIPSWPPSHRITTTITIFLTVSPSPVQHRHLPSRHVPGAFPVPSDFLHCSAYR